MYQNKDILVVLITDYNITAYFEGIISVETISLSSARSTEFDLEAPVNFLNRLGLKLCGTLLDESNI